MESVSTQAVFQPRGTQNDAVERLTSCPRFVLSTLVYSDNICLSIGVCISLKFNGITTVFGFIYFITIGFLMIKIIILN